MRTSQYLLSTLKEIPADATVISHQLMLRAGMIRQLSSGLYSWLPTGLRVLRKVENIIREEITTVGAMEIAMPIVQPADLWQESGRLVQYGPELLHFLDRGARPFVLGPTHEEVITDLIRNEVSSYRQLPLVFYQIQTKFRDEVRPRFGVIRAREFIMKDAYSFHISQASLQTTYDAMYYIYSIIFTRMGLKFRAVTADTGSIGGNVSHEFQVLANSGGKDEIYFSTGTGSTASIRVSPSEVMRLVDTPGVGTITEMAAQFLIPVEKIVKTLLVHACQYIGYPLVALIVRGDHQLDDIKAEKLPQVATPLTFANEEEIRLIVGAGPNSLGPVYLPLPMIIDHSVALMSDFAAGANADGKYLFGINWERDLPLPPVADLRKVVVNSNNVNLDELGSLQMQQGIEVGHIFQLGTKYSEAMNAIVQGEDGHNQTLTMGCYGIGITRVVAAVIEQNHDEYGILWPESIAPFNVAILPINMHKSYRVQEVAEDLYKQLQALGIDVLFDDRKERPGVMFADMELIGIPHQLIIGDKNLDVENIEYKNRRSSDKQIIRLSAVVNFLVNAITTAK